MQTLIRELRATESQAERALRSTMSKMAAWLRVRSVKGLSGHLKIQQKVLRRRLRTYRMQSSLGSAWRTGNMKVWYGLNPIPFADLHPKQTATGVRADGGREVKGAFIARVRGRPRVFKRTGTARLPLVEEKVPLYDPAIVYIEDVLIGTALFDAHFMTLFEHELTWRTSTRT
ncbi:hypothetical protein EO087_01850 [Dyella sp. M7H15-1]|nr:hypothetical protein EO087_01850 [Dyella sp. M7H15-1]